MFISHQLRLATVGVISAVTSSLTQQICLCGNELMKRICILSSKNNDEGKLECTHTTLK